MKGFIVSCLFILSFSSFALDAEYKNCSKKLVKDFRESAAPGHSLNQSKIYASYLKYGSISSQIEELAIILNIEICTDVSYGVLGRTVSYIYSGDDSDIEQFDNIISEAIEAAR